MSTDIIGCHHWEGVGCYPALTKTRGAAKQFAMNRTAPHNTQLVIGRQMSVMPRLGNAHLEESLLSTAIHTT